MSREPKTPITILSVAVDENLVREGLQLAVSDRLAILLRTATEIVNELRGGGCAIRADYEDAFERVQREYLASLPLLDFAGAWAEPDDDGAATPEEK